METEKKILWFRGKAIVLIDWANVHGWYDVVKWAVDPQKLYNFLSNYHEIIDKRFYCGLEIGNQKSEEFQKLIKSIGFNLISKEMKWVPVYIEKSYLKKLIKDLFEVLDNTKDVNSKICNKLYELSRKVDGLPKVNNSDSHQLELNEKQFKEIFDIIEELDSDLKKLNIDIGELKNKLGKPIFRRKCDFDCEIVMDVMNSLNNFDTMILFSGDGDYKAIVEYLLDQNKRVIIIHPKNRRGKEFNLLLNRENNKPGFVFIEKFEEFLK